MLKSYLRICNYLSSTRYDENGITCDGIMQIQDRMTEKSMYELGYN
jgi:hypothetical protein